LLPPPAVGIPGSGDNSFDNVVGVRWFTNGAFLAGIPTAGAGW
jgi:hypothetical protein